jgi:hypothetical protein
MDPIYTFDPERFHLGTLCRHGHRWPGTDLSLRRTSHHPAQVHSCIGCTGRKASSWLISFIDAQAMGFPDGWQFGKLCKEGHKWNNQEMSIRDKYGKCPECEKIRRQSDQYKEHHAQIRKVWEKNNKDRRRQSDRDAYAKRRTNPEAWTAFLEKKKIRKRNRNQRFAEQGLTSRIAGRSSCQPRNAGGFTGRSRAAFALGGH